MNVNSLRTLVLRDRTINNDNDETWHDFENKLGIGVPHDYRKLMIAYGGGMFCQTLNILSPFSIEHNIVNSHFALVQHTQDFPASFNLESYSLYPDDNGLLTVGLEQDGRRLMWETVGSPEDWPLVWVNMHLEEIEVFRMPLVEYLIEWSTGSIIPEVEAYEKNAPMNRPPFFKPLDKTQWKPIEIKGTPRSN